MKKISYILMLALVAMMGFTSCSDEDYDSKYTDPSKTSTVSCEKLMTGVFLAGKQYAQATYWRLFTFDTQFIGRLASTYGYTSSKDAYGGVAESYNNDRWENFYDMLTQYKLQQYTYNNLSASEQKRQKIYLLCSQIYVYDQLQQMVDLWGDVPYSEACTVQLTGDVSTCYPSYDTAEELYSMMMDSLSYAIDELWSIDNGSGLDSDIASAFSSQDYICGGDVSAWGRYANGLLARIAMRCATNGSLTSKARTMLASCYGSANPYFINSTDDEIRIDVGQASGDWNLVDNWLMSGWESWTHSCNTASQFMLDLMRYDYNVPDPRLKVMFAYNNDAQVYRGKSAFEVPDKQSALSDSANYYSCLDSATFSRNAGYFEPTMTAAEFLLTGAEAAARGYITNYDAKTLFVDGVKASIDYYFELNAASSFYSDAYHAAKFARPSDEVINEYVENLWDTENPVRCICEQYWIHLGIPYAVQAYSNVRRTGYPNLTYVDWSSSATEYPLPFDRLKYPTSEVMNNTTKYQEAITNQFGGTDTWYSHIFWAMDGQWYETTSEPK